MSSIKVVYRIIPKRARSRSYSNLISASDVDIPQTVEISSFTDAKSRIYSLETTYCEKNLIPSGADLHSKLAEQCESISGLLLLEKISEKSSLSDASENNEVIPCTEDSTNELQKDKEDGFKLYIPTCIASSSIPRTEHSSTSEVDSDVTINSRKKTQLKSKRKVSNAIINRRCRKKRRRRGSRPYTLWVSKSEQQEFEKIMKPLYKYIQDQKCLICGFVSKSKNRYLVRLHLVTHLPKKHFKCDICEKAFATPRNRAVHKLLHSEKYPFSCDICEEKFKRGRQLAAHKRRHKHPTNYSCAFCGKEFSSKETTRMHQTIHTGEKPYQCSVCYKTFRTSESLLNHSYEHSDKKRFTCDVCEKSYNSRNVYNAHVNSHYNSNSFKCEICDKTFNFKPNLTQHMLIHSDVRKHKCATCGMAFKLPHHLRNHIATHDDSASE